MVALDGRARMNLSPIQLLKTRLLKVAVEPNSDNPATEDGSSKVWPNGFNIEHLTHIKRFERKSDAKPEPDEGDQRIYIVMLGMRTTEDSKKQLPYSFQVVVTGMISAAQIQGKTPLQIDDMAAQYGYSLLYGQIRETIANLTSRMKWQTFTMPTLSFMDAKFPVSGETNGTADGESGTNITV
jgi:hypothetical protein